MKLKKLLAVALSLSTFATAAVSVSAAFEYYEDGMVFISEMPSKAEVEARTPSVSVNVEKLDNATFSSVDPVYNNTWAKKKDETTGAYLYDMYRVTYTFDNVGALALGYMDDKSGVGIMALTADIKITEGAGEIKAQKVKGNPITGFSASCGLDKSTNVLTNGVYTTEATNPYPTFGGGDELGVIATATSFSVASLYVVNAGKVVKFAVEPASGISYGYLNNGTPANIPVACTLPAENAFTLGTVAVDPASVAITGAPTTAIKVGATAALTATVDPAAADQTITWTSSNNDVATVSNGTVTAVAPGKATIKAASSKAGVEATVEIKVLPKVTGADDVAEYEGTYIWKNVTINGAKYGTNYEVTFAADGAEKTKALDISAIEVGGDVSFPILLKGAPAAPTATIGCDWIDAQ